MATPPPKTTKFCVNCGAEIDIRAEICPKCGVRVAPPPQAQPVPSPEPAGVKSPVLAIILSFIFPGIGQLYNGETGKGALYIVIAIIGIAATLIVIGFIIYLAVWIYGIIDAYNGAHRVNQKLGVRRDV